MQNDAGQFLAVLRKKNPLILNLTNYVSIDFVANGLLSVGASPVMSHDEQDALALINIVSALVINIGTLDSQFIQLINKVCQYANQKLVPIFLDPVGAGATPLRTKIAQELIAEHRIAVVRGNGSEILALAGKEIQSKGVDSSSSSQAAIDAGLYLSDKYKTTVVISGRTDYIISNSQVKENYTGCALMSKITGTGCLLTAVIAAFCADQTHYCMASQSALAFYGFCGEQAAKVAKGPGSFKTAFLDALNGEIDERI
jgi:hydroxyethylthiazole kinase